MSNISDRKVRVKSVCTEMVVEASAPRFKPSTFTWEPPSCDPLKRGGKRLGENERL